jgi:alpha-ketoglutarate-dependent dioxygenase FTO
MEPTSHTKVGFKDEAHYGMGKVSVSWHADSSLEDNSSIAVYHCLPTQRKAQWDWRIALRSIPGKRKGKDKDFLPVSVSTADGDCYFLLGTFNQMHQHCVLAGSESNRISSTHRVAVTKQDTYQYILKRVKNALKRLNLQVEKQKVSDLDARVIIFCQKVLTEVEMEWIAQYWLQGAQHNEMRLWWQQPLDILESMWTKLEELTFRLYQICIEEPSIGSDVVEGFLEELTVRNKQRNIWDERRADKIYQRRVSPSFRPVARPLFDNTQVSKLPKDLSRAIRELKIASKRNTSAASTIRNDKHDVSNNTSKRSMTTGKSVGLKKKKQRNGNQKRK